LPLLVIVAVAFSVFWIHPEDLNTKASIGVTCLLAAIAFQLAEAGMLPEVAYLTLADRVYAICYTMLALSLMLAVNSSAEANRARTIFPSVRSGEWRAPRDPFRRWVRQLAQGARGH
jgi:hypothetical protein